jgi:hypothetical protein
MDCEARGVSLESADGSRSQRSVVRVGGWIVDAKGVSLKLGWTPVCA